MRRAASLRPLDKILGLIEILFTTGRREFSAKGRSGIGEGSDGEAGGWMRGDGERLGEGGGEIGRRGTLRRYGLRIGFWG